MLAMQSMMQPAMQQPMERAGQTCLISRCSHACGLADLVCCACSVLRTSTTSRTPCWPPSASAWALWSSTWASARSSSSSSEQGWRSRIQSPAGSRMLISCSQSLPGSKPRSRRPALAGSSIRSSCWTRASSSGHKYQRARGAGSAADVHRCQLCAGLNVPDSIAHEVLGIAWIV